VQFEEARGVLEGHDLTVLAVKPEREREGTSYSASLRHEVPVDLEQVADALMERLGSRGLIRVTWH
jgi:hypothetical protein